MDRKLRCLGSSERSEIERFHNGVKLAIYGGKNESGAVIAAGYENWVDSGAHIHPARSHTIPSHTHTADDHTHRVEIVPFSIVS